MKASKPLIAVYVLVLGISYWVLINITNVSNCC